jgi:UDP-N-acetylmuramoyl-tripeptide--D-alanyl-D-alanine ligase
MKKLVQKILKVFVKMVIKKYRPFIIAVTGSVGKTSTKEGIYTAFSGLYNIQRSAGNLNTELGAPLVFLRQNKSGENFKEWLLIILKSFWLLLKKDKKYPKIIVVELAADKPGDIGYFSEFIKSDIAVITAVGEVPVHIEFYKTPQDVANEKEKILSVLEKEKIAVLNFDDPFVARMKTKAKKITFGFKEGADILIKKFETKSIDGSSLVLEYKKEDFPLFLSSCIGDSFAYIAASIFAVGVALKIDSQKLPSMIEKIRPSKGRLTTIKGIKNTVILDGSYNASPSSMLSALRALKELEGKRKIAVLGDMLELGKFSIEEHKKIGKFAGEFADYIISIGTWSEEIKKGAVQSDIIEKEKIFSFKNTKEAAQKLEKIISDGDIILVKGSQGIRTEKIVFSIMRDPERAEEILVRQENYWKNL